MEHDDSMQKAYSWLGAHGQPSYAELRELATAGTSEALEQLHVLADDNNIPYDQATDLLLLAQQIFEATGGDPNRGVE